ncbi:MAG TPA: RNA polymerase sigma-70 factor [Pedobacter sp.]
MLTSYATQSDQQLVSLLKDGDHKAYTEIYTRYWEKLFIVAHNRLKDSTEAEEVVQDVFYSIWKRRDTLELQYSLTTYLSVAVKYQVINLQAKLHYKAVHEDIQYNTGQAVETTELWFAEKELKEQLKAAIDKLPEKCRIVFLKSREEHKSNAEIAAELNVSEKTVEAHITRALHTLKNSLQISVPLILYLLKK